MMRCKHPGCRNEGEPCYINIDVLQPEVYYCLEHKEQHGFCLQCGVKLNDEEIEDHTGICIPCVVALDAISDDPNDLFTEH